MAKFKKYNFNTGRGIYFEDGQFYSDKSLGSLNKIVLSDKETVEFWKCAKQVLTGEDLFNIIKPHLEIAFHGETYSDEESLDNLERVDGLMAKLLESIDSLNGQVEGRNENSAVALRERLAPILDGIMWHTEEWR